jgi:hypothetical protein
LAIIQSGISFTLLILSGLLIRSFYQLTTADKGFEPNHVLSIEVDLRQTHTPPPLRSRVYAALLEQFQALHTVTSAARATVVPISGSMWQTEVRTTTAGPRSGNTSYVNTVSPGYFRTLSIPLLAGRDFQATDTPLSPKIAIVNQQFSDRFFAGHNPIGDSFWPVPSAETEPIQIVGVVGDSLYRSIREGKRPTYYLADTQVKEPEVTTNYLLSYKGDPGQVIGNVSTVLSHYDKRISVRCHSLALQSHSTENMCLP